MLRQNFNHHNHHQLNQTDLRLFIGLLQAFVIFIDLLLLDRDVPIIRRDVLIPFKIDDNAIRMLAAAALPIVNTTAYY